MCQLPFSFVLFIAGKMCILFYKYFTYIPFNCICRQKIWLSFITAVKTLSLAVFLLQLQHNSFTKRLCEKGLPLWSYAGLLKPYLFLHEQLLTEKDGAQPPNNLLLFRQATT